MLFQFLFGALDYSAGLCVHVLSPSSIDVKPARVFPVLYIYLQISDLIINKNCTVS